MNTDNNLGWWFREEDLDLNESLLSEGDWNNTWDWGRINKWKKRVAQWWASYLPKNDLYLKYLQSTKFANSIRFVYWDQASTKIIPWIFVALAWGGALYMHGEYSITKPIADYSLEFLNVIWYNATNLSLSLLNAIESTFDCFEIIARYKFYIALNKKFWEDHPLTKSAKKKYYFALCWHLVTTTLMVFLNIEYKDKQLLINTVNLMVEHIIERRLLWTTVFTYLKDWGNTQPLSLTAFWIAAIIIFWFWSYNDNQDVNNSSLKPRYVLSKNFNANFTYEAKWAKYYIINNGQKEEPQPNQMQILQNLISCNFYNATIERKDVIAEEDVNNNPEEPVKIYLYTITTQNGVKTRMLSTREFSHDYLQVLSITENMTIYKIWDISKAYRQEVDSDEVWNFIIIPDEEYTIISKITRMAYDRFRNPQNNTSQPTVTQ